METRLKTSQQKTKTQPRCHYCGAIEGKPHPIRGLTVSLQQMKYYAGKQACQICRLYYQEITPPSIQKIKTPMNSKVFYTCLLFSFILVLIFSAIVLAQPPGLPGSPDQAPIDGGLGLLAAAGGAYALKKLRDRKAE